MKSFSSPPKISILTPSYNQGQFIEDLIVSVIEQEYPNYEHIIIDGGSIDNTLEVLRKYDKKIIWESKPDAGQTDAVNKGWGKCTGDVVTWINADDWFEPGAFAVVMRCFADHPEVNVVHGHWYDADVQRMHLKLKYIPQITPTLLRRYCPGNVAMFFRRHVFEQCIPLDISLQYAMDLELLLKAVKAGAIFFHSGVPLASMRRHPGQKGSRYVWGTLKESRIVLPSRYFGKPTVLDHLYLVRQWALSQIKIKFVDPIRSQYRRKVRPLKEGKNYGSK